MKRGEVDLVVTGADRIARQRRHRQQDRHVLGGGARAPPRHPVLRGGALLHHRPVDPDGAAIAIEERDARRGAAAWRAARPRPSASPVCNPAFDVTPGRADHRASSPSAASSAPRTTSREPAPGRGAERRRRPTGHRGARRYHDAHRALAALGAGERPRPRLGHQALPFKIYPDLPRRAAAARLPAAARRHASRRSRATRAAPGALDLERLAALLFFSAGVTQTKTYPGGGQVHFRAAPSTGALYQTEVYVVAGDVAGLAPGVYHFWPGRLRAAAAARGRLPRARSPWPRPTRTMAARPAILVLTGDLLAQYLEVPGARLPAPLLGLGHACSRTCSRPRRALDLPARVVTGLRGRRGQRAARARRRARKARSCSSPSAPRARPAPPPPVDRRHRARGRSRSPRREVDYPLLVDAYVELVASSRRPRCSTGARPGGGARDRRSAARGSLTPLPPPLHAAGRSLGETIQARGSTREFSGEAIGGRGPVERALPRHARLRRRTCRRGWWISTSASTRWTASRRAPTPTIRGAHALELHQGGRRAERDSAFLCLEQALGGMSSATVFFLADLARAARRARQPRLSRWPTSRRA